MMKTKNLKLTEEELVKECKRLALRDVQKIDVQTTSEGKDVLRSLYQKWYTKLKSKI